MYAIESAEVYKCASIAMNILMGFSRKVSLP